MATAASSNEPAMRRALELARRGLGTTSPNPVVGAVILDRDGKPVGEGWHARAGGPHAEIAALGAAGHAARGGTAVITLEPCAHAGRSAGVEVHAGLLLAEAAEVNEAWLHGVRTGRPFLTWKYAATLDGRSAAADRTSRWITGLEARADVHRLRAESDAVLVGVGTVLADDPQLTARDAPAARQPLRVVLDTDGLTPDGARVRNGDADTAVLTGADVKRGPDGRIDLGAALGYLYERDVRSVLLEGGPTLAGAFLAAGLVDKVIGYLAPLLLGAGPPALGDAGIPTITAARRLRITGVTRLGADLRITGYPSGAQ